MKEVYIIGAHESVHGNRKDANLRKLIAEAGNAAIADAGIDRHEIQALYMGNYNGNGFNNQNTLAAMAASSLGIPEVPTQRFEAACASGGVAFRNAMIAVASGIYDTVMVMGVEKMNIPLDQADADSQMNWAKSGVDYQYESGVGMNGATMFAMFAHRHMHEYGTTREMLAISASKNKYHGSLNPYAYKQREVPVEKIMKSPLIATPFSAQEVSLVTDGSAAVILTTKDRAKSMGKKDAVKVMGSGHGGGSFSVAFRDSFTRMRATVEAANEAFKMANIDRKDISVVECHDCFSFTELMNIEDLGFVEKGKGGWFAADGNTRLGGKLPVNTSGGLCSKGHPIGATGVGQIVEMAWQLQDKSDKRQVENAKFALTHVLGGPGSVSTVHILGRGDI